jgi:hypothetical protein
MRLKDLFVLGIASTLAGCAPRPAPTSLAACQGRILATVTNGHAVSYDYGDSRGSTALGEVRARSTSVYTLPGAGQGQVWVQRAAADGGSQRWTGGQTSGAVRIRKHCTA